MKIENDEIQFSSGRTMYANRGIVGLSPALGLYEGYDGWVGPVETLKDSDVSDWLELADHMIAQWTKFKETVQGR